MGGIFLAIGVIWGIIGLMYGAISESWMSLFMVDGPALLVLAIGAILTIRECFYTYKNNIEKHKSNIEIYTKQESELSTKLESLLSKYISLEKELITSVKERNTGELIALAERYPELQASTSVKELLSQITNLRSGITKAEKMYNQAVEQYKNHFVQFRWFEPEDLTSNDYEYL